MGRRITPSRIRLARRRCQLTKESLATLLGVNTRTVRAYEVGEHDMSEEVLAKLSSVLDFPREFFFGIDLEEPLENAVSFRSMSKLTAKQRDTALSQGAIAFHLNNWIESKFELPPVNLPDLRHEATPEDAAAALRQYWPIGNLPIRNMIHLLEANGVRVFSLSIEAKEVDAFSIWQDGTPFVLLNTFKSSEHARFDAAHELGHLVLHKHGSPSGVQAENEAHRFASAFLMPSASVLAHAPRMATISELMRLKKIWIVSVAAVNYRLRELKLLSEWHYRTLCIEIAKRGYRSTEPQEAPRETSAVLPKLFTYLHQNEGVTRNQVAQELQISITELESVLFGLVMTGLEGGKRNPAGQSSKSSLVRIK